MVEVEGLHQGHMEQFVRHKNENVDQQQYKDPIAGLLCCVEVAVVARGWHSSRGG